ncbi:hypothetical protein [Larkinella humicola]|uniref:Uncharacterized protein n=1 Tax=Larkinella humicola TaxID=2607654 RepID=A0A5N1JN90_9BACT|nr:hypothetical protein [Larkinella humicola]KAA9356907.1 hypothetical protein F0P93_03975 [Larkinella humicola]
MEKKWRKINEGIYTFFVGNEKEGSLSMNTAGGKATAIVGSKQFTIRRTGFWQSSLEIFDQDERQVARAYPETWYGNSMVFEYEGRTYQLKIKSNPLAEWSILAEKQAVLSYGLTVDQGKTVVAIHSQAGNLDYLPDFLLWYLFEPIAAENTADPDFFLTLAV